jgi:hypothetical protein
MKRTTLGCLAGMLLAASAAHAQILNTAPQQETLSLDLVCPMTATVTATEPNPPLSAEITGEAQNGQLRWLEVVYTLRDGRRVRRGDQYINTRIWTERGQGIKWSGTYARDSRKTIEGHISGDPSSLLYYGERHFTNGVQDSQTITPCVKRTTNPPSAAETTDQPRYRVIEQSR